MAKGGISQSGKVSDISIKRKGKSDDELPPSKRLKEAMTDEIENLESFVFGGVEGKKEISDYEESESGSDAPAWVDDDDENIKINITSQNMLKKLRKSLNERIIDGAEYQERLREQFNKTVGNNNNSWVSKKKESNDNLYSDESEDEYGGVNLSNARQRLLRDAAPVVHGKSHVGEGPLPMRDINIRRVNDLTITVRSSKPNITKVQFHPSNNKVAMTLSTADRSIRVYNVDGQRNSCQKQTTWSNLVLRDSTFTPDGSSIISVCDHSVSIPVLDLETGKHSVVSSLIGHNSQAPFKSIVSGPSPFVEPSLKTNSLLAVGSSDGSVNFLDARTRHVVRNIQLTAPAVSSGFFPGKDLFVTATAADACVCIWDVRTGRCLNRFIDTSAFQISAMAMTPFSTNISRSDSNVGTWLTTGSKTGIVSFYGLGASATESSNDLDDTSVSNSLLVSKKPLKTVSNLTTVADRLAFHPSGELVAVASSEDPKNLKLVHVASGTVFQNWPGNQVNFRGIECITFSTDGDYMAIGNKSGDVSMMQLQHYAAKLKITRSADE